MPHSCCSKHKMTISRVFASRNFRIVPKMATKIADEWMWWRNSALDALLNATCAPKSDGKLRWETLIVHSPTVCNPNSLALHSTFLQHEKDFYCPPFDSMALAFTYNKIAAYSPPKSMLFDSSDCKSDTLCEWRSVLEANVLSKREPHQPDKLEEGKESLNELL